LQTSADSPSLSLSFSLFNLSSITMPNNDQEMTPLPSEWENDQEMMDEELSAVSSEEASKVFEQWQTDDQDQDMDIMDVDEQLGSTLLGDELFPDSCASPTGPLEELSYLSFDNEEVDKFSLSLLNITADENDENKDESTTGSNFEERYKESFQKLAASMKRSRETRKSLVMKTSKTEEYRRAKSVNGVIKKIQKSTEQLQVYLNNTV
jgi:hypothetical protein